MPNFYKTDYNNFFGLYNINGRKAKTGRLEDWRVGGGER
jgi:hypothetical protein